MANIKKIIKDKKALGLRPLIMNIVILTLFSFCIIAFSFGFIQITNPESDLLKSPINNSLLSLNNSLSTFNDVSIAVKEQLGESEPTTTDYLFLMFEAAFYIPMAFLAFGVTGIVTIIDVLYLSFGGGIFGAISLTIIGLISSGLIVTLVFLILTSIRSGSSER